MDIMAQLVHKRQFLYALLIPGWLSDSLYHHIISKNGKSCHNNQLISQSIGEDAFHQHPASTANKERLADQFFFPEKCSMKLNKHSCGRPNGDIS
jgi:hypothetical protein